MNEYRNEQGAVQPENEQQTRVMQPVEETARPVRHRRAARYQQQDAAQEAQPSRTELPDQGGRVQTRYGAQTPIQREVPSQGVPRPAALERVRQEPPPPVTPPVRRPVGAPGYPKRPQPGPAQRQPVQMGELPRARRPIPMEENEPAHDEQDRRAGKGYGVLAAILVVIHDGCGIVLWPSAFTLTIVLRAANDVKFPMVASILSMVIFRLGGGYILAVVMGYGAVGIWIAMVMDWIVRVICFVGRYCSGKWKTFYKAAV